MIDKLEDVAMAPVLNEEYRGKTARERCTDIQGPVRLYWEIQDIQN